MPSRLHSTIRCIRTFYGCVMAYPGYSLEALMFALVYLLKNKAEGLCSVQMTEAHRILWPRTYLSTTYFA
jgi:hypothetical protein